jgi:nitrogen fixation protein NifZ
MNTDTNGKTIHTNNSASIDIDADRLAREHAIGIEGLQQGDVVYAAQSIYNDGSLPEHGEDAVLAPAGSRGVIVNIGHLEQQPEQILFLVRFEDQDEEALLGPPIGCWPDDLSASVVAVC